MQVLFPKHVWLHTEYMPTLDWRTGASYISHRVITILWWITSGIIIHHRSNAYESFPTGPCYVTLLLLLLYCYCCYFVATAVTLLLLVTVATAAIILPCYWYFAADTKYFRCGWIDNSTANTWEYSFASPWVESINLGWILYPRKLLRSPILVDHHKAAAPPHPSQRLPHPVSTWETLKRRTRR